MVSTQVYTNNFSWSNDPRKLRATRAITIMFSQNLALKVESQTVNYGHLYLLFQSDGAYKATSLETWDTRANLVEVNRRIYYFAIVALLIMLLCFIYVSSKFVIIHYITSLSWLP